MKTSSDLDSCDKRGLAFPWLADEGADGKRGAPQQSVSRFRNPLILHIPYHFKAKVNVMFAQAKIHAHIRALTTYLNTLRLPLLAVALLAGGVFGPAGTAWAQVDDEPAISKVVFEKAPVSSADGLRVTNAPWRTHFGEHAAMVLRESNSSAKKVAMRDLIVLANGRGEMDLSATLPPLLRIVEVGPSTVHRLMALQALYLIGTEHSSESEYRRAMEKLYQIAREEPRGQVRSSAVATLIGFYGSKKDN